MKDFDDWNTTKKNIETKPQSRLSFHEREVWWASIGLNLGFEQDGKNALFERPVLIIKKFNKSIAWILPLTSRQKIGPYYHKVGKSDKGSVVIISQLRLISTKRLRRFMGKISPHQFELIRTSIIRLLS